MNQTLLRIAAVLLALSPVPTLAQYPDRPIKMVVPYAAGGGADSTARIVGQQMSQALGQQIVIENRPGAGGVIGADFVAKAPADGYTLLFDASAFAANPTLRKLPFDPKADFIPVSLVVIAPNILVASPKAPYKTVAELLDFARKNPEKATYASAGAGSASHLAGEALNHTAGLNIVHVPYRGGAPALNDVIGDRVSLYFGNTASTLGQVTSGSVRALAIGSPKRSPLLPEVPTLIESGLKDFETQEWNGLFAPKGTPPAIVERLSREIVAAVANPEIKAKLEKLGLEPVGNKPDAFARFLDDEIGRAAATVKSRNIKLD
ncbi:Bug family tripartite tricarboxylate transporter substrate binding protein [Bosea psychrotolerans]|uniref:Tripartite-type tricarboxylate transporter receptor subunit TctC n=1 Tax=Bosea psychrotolerans TaxID=1871628 RepID=A0A2S4M6S4_9HYPH|nr:tripartite tricarboxylate transporter substrate binding protein [Bosea psychrotolerans]POR50325.1 tripartite-type tricarboxylate transporter receptor subunit TctC [Bosea psychrotolerans]